MDPNATPWRVLEDPVEIQPGPASETVRAAPRWAIGRSALVVGAAAVALAVGAFVLAAGASSGGSVIVDGGSALPGESAGLAGRGGPTATGGGTASKGLLVVEIVGAVDRPGVYRLAGEARVGDLVAAAGGYGPRVDTDRAARELNLAAPLHDGDQVRVPARGDVATAPSTAGGGAGAKPGAGSSAPIDLNRATATELDTLPGIGPATAAKILASRDEQPFTTVDDLRSRKLVGEKTFANLKDLVAVH